MDFKALEYICAISEAQTISQAAKNLFISQPALSQYLSKVEQELGTPLFVRTGSTMTLTSAGAIVVREGRALLTARKELVGQVASLASGRAETLRFGISPFYSKYYLPLLLPYYRANHPHIRLNIVEQSSTELEQRVLDAHAVPSGGTPYLDLGLLRNEPFVELVPSLKFSMMSRRIFRHFSITPNVIYESTSWDTVCMLVAHGIGVGFLPKVLMHRHLHEPRFYRICGIDSTRTYSAVYASQHRLSHSALNLINVFQRLLEGDQS